MSTRWLMLRPRRPWTPPPEISRMMHRPNQGEPIREKLQRIQHLRRSPWDFAFLYADEPVIGLVFDIRGSSCLFLSPSDLSPLNFPELPPSLRRGVPMRAPQFFRIGSGHQVANRPLASPFTPQISFMWEGNIVASNNRSLSLRPSGLLAVLADQTKGNSAFGLRRLLTSQLADTGSPRYQWDMLRRQTENCAGGTSTRKFNS